MAKTKANVKDLTPEQALEGLIGLMNDDEKTEYQALIQQSEFTTEEKIALAEDIMDSDPDEEEKTETSTEPNPADAEKAATDPAEETDPADAEEDKRLAYKYAMIEKGKKWTIEERGVAVGVLWARKMNGTISEAQFIELAGILGYPESALSHLAPLNFFPTF